MESRPTSLKCGQKKGKCRFCPLRLLKLTDEWGFQRERQHENPFARGCVRLSVPACVSALALYDENPFACGPLLCFFLCLVTVES